MSGDAGTERVVRRGRPTGDHAARRAELLKAAASVIAQEGYANASLRKVAQRAGCTTGAVTYYFANKEELVAALAESRFDTYDAMLDAVRDRVDVKALFEQWLARTADDPDFWPVMSQLLAHARYELPPPSSNGVTHASAACTPRFSRAGRSRARFATTSPPICSRTSSRRWVTAG